MKYSQRTEYWLRARDATSGPSQIEPRRQQYIELPSVRRAVDTPRHCLFSECSNTKRYRIPDNVRRRGLCEKTSTFLVVLEYVPFILIEIFIMIYILQEIVVTVSVTHKLKT